MAVTVSRTKPAPVVIKSHASFRGAGNSPLLDSHGKRACCGAGASPHLTSPQCLTPQRHPTPSASSLFQLSSRCVLPSLAARAQKQSRAQEAPNAAATRCRLLLQATEGPSTRRYRTRFHPEEWLRRPCNAGCYNFPELLGSFLHLWMISWLLASFLEPLPCLEYFSSRAASWWLQWDPRTNF